MVIVIEGAEAWRFERLFETMFEDRKRLFVDLLSWKIPVVDGRFERDQFDGEQATYLIALEDDGTHAGSMRLLPATGPHILSELFSSLCAGAVPRGRSTFEITRLCLPTRHGAGGRLTILNQLISKMVDHALNCGIDTLTGVVEASFLVKVLEMGWDCRPLGPTLRLNGAKLGAFAIEIDAGTPERLAARGIYTWNSVRAPLAARVAA